MGPARFTWPRVERNECKLTSGAGPSYEGRSDLVRVAQSAVVRRSSCTTLTGDTNAAATVANFDASTIAGHCSDSTTGAHLRFFFHAVVYMHRLPPGRKRRCAQCVRSRVLRSWRAKIFPCSSIRLIFPNNTWQQNIAEATCGPAVKRLPSRLLRTSKMLARAYSSISTPGVSSTTPFRCREKREDCSGHARRKGLKWSITGRHGWNGETLL